jgi:hypothetical protein
MPVGSARLSLLPFPQFWDGGSMTVRFLCLPKGDPQAPLQAGLPVFADAHLVFDAKLIGGLGALPYTAAATGVGPLTLDAPPLQKTALFAELTKQFNITAPPAVVRPQPQFRKAMTESYAALIGGRRRSQYLYDAEEFACALHQGALDQLAAPVLLSDSVRWGQVIAFALRQPNLAGGLGLILQSTFTPPDGIFANGGWLYIDLDAASDYAATLGIAAHYAARIPPLDGTPRVLFAPLLFPVTNAPGNFIADDVYREAERYEDGLAKMVHCAQTAGKGDGIQLAWEDEQIAEWLNRQVQRDAAGELLIDAPLGVAGYRVDVRVQGGDWHSLVQIASLGDLRLGPYSLGSFRGEAVIEVSPAQISPKQDGLFWFPSYFATWRGASLALTDADLTALHARPDVQTPDTPPYLLNRERNFAPVNEKVVPLRYGMVYDFRVRLADLTRGGPDASVSSPEPPRDSITSVLFQRRKPPGPVEILRRPPDVVRQVHIGKPRLGYPEILFTGMATFADLALDLDQLAADPSITREISLPDPDVLTVNIDVRVKALAGDGDADGYCLLYRTSRTWEADEMTVEFDVQDHATLREIGPNQPTDGPILIPSARDVRLTFTGMGRDNAGYFVDDTARTGAAVNVDIRAEAATEAELLSEPEAFSALRSFFFQPPPPDNSVASPIERLAAELKLGVNGLTLTSPAGSRTVMACSAELRHTLAPEASAITFASAADLISRWINVMQFTLERDWTWNGLDPSGISVTRVVHLPTGDTITGLGSITLPRAMSRQSLAGVPADPRANVRQSTEVIFFDAYDPKPVPPQKFPSEVTLDYVLQPAFRVAPAPPPLNLSILLPVTTRPTQVPRIVSAGIALSEYKKADDYSSTEKRTRKLWFEFAAPPEDPDDAYFVRVLAMGPDPMLLDRNTATDYPPDAVETPLPLDPEWMRLITPGQPRDENGLNAMDQVAESATAPHYLIPLPDHLQESSPELFGFFVYEVRVGHTASRWVTAQSRYGPMLRIAGVQHPAPPLVCEAARSKSGVLIRAPFATPVINGANIRPIVPATELWALLYARVVQTDASSWRNVLLARVPLLPPRVGNDPLGAGARVLYGEALIPEDAVESALRSLALPANTPLTVLAAEMFANPAEEDPLGNRLGHARILRISPLAAVPGTC